MKKRSIDYEKHTQLIDVLRAKRVALGMTKQKLETTSRVSRTTIIRFLGKRASTSLLNFVLLCDALGLDVTVNERS